MLTDTCAVARVAGAVITIVVADEPARLEMVLAESRTVAGVGIVAIRIRGVATGCACGFVGVIANTGEAVILRAIIPVAAQPGTGGTVRLVVDQTIARVIASIRVVAIGIGRIAASNTRWLVGVITYAVVAFVVRAIVAVICTGRTVGFVVIQANTRGVARIRVRTVVI